MKTSHRSLGSVLLFVRRSSLQLSFLFIGFIILPGCGFQITFYDFNGDPIGQPKVKPRMVEEDYDYATHEEEEEVFYDESEGYIDFFTPYDEPPTTLIPLIHCNGQYKTIVIVKEWPWDRPRRCPYNGSGRPRHPCITYVYEYR